MIRPCGTPKRLGALVTISSTVLALRVDIYSDMPCLLEHSIVHAGSDHISRPDTCGGLPLSCSGSTQTPVPTSNSSHGLDSTVSLVLPVPEGCRSAVLQVNNPTQSVMYATRRRRDRAVVSRLRAITGDHMERYETRPLSHAQALPSVVK